MSLEYINEAISDVTGIEAPIAQNIASLAQDVRSSYAAIAAKNGTVPARKNMDNIADAIDTIESLEV